LLLPLINECEPDSCHWQSVRIITICKNIPVAVTIKTVRHDITESRVKHL
jgi:hypothetical protein